MKFRSSLSLKRCGFFPAVFFFAALAVTVSKAQIGLFPPEPKIPLAQLLNPVGQQDQLLGIPLDRKPILYPSLFQHSVQIDTFNQWITIRQRLADTDVFIPQRLLLSDYLKIRSSIELNNDWRKNNASKVTAPKDGTRTSQGLTIASPKIKSETFRRMFGGDNLSLNVTGNITINGEMQNEKRSQTKTAVDRAPNTNFEMKQTQNFKVTGKIGENVSVDVDQDSERMFEFENNIRLKYSSEEDGIIQSIEAGNVSLSLPATRFVTFSAQNAGLFGIKTQMKVGGLDVTAIASMEKGEKKKLTLTGGKEDAAPQQIFDYDYKRNTYFFLSYGFRNNFKKLDNDYKHLADLDSTISDIEVYKSDNNYMNQGASFYAWALFDPKNKKDTLKSDAMHYKGYFIRLEPLKDFFVDKQLGFIAMNTPLQESEVLAVAYRDASKHQYGTLLADLNSKDKIVLKLIKPKEPRPKDSTWYLEWKNVYSIGSRDMQPEGFDLKIYHKTPSGDPEQALPLPSGPKGYLEVFGLDRMDTKGNNKPDNIIDNNDNFLRLSRGELIFPDLKPFDPEDASDLPNELRTGAIYDTLDQAYIRNQSKFYIEVKSSSRSANFSLGMNVIENSEEVILNGERLSRDKNDYIIDYTSGSLTILRDEAKDPNAKLEINYESQQMISVDKKSLLGLRAEYKFREDAAQPSFIGGTILYMNQQTMDQRIRLGQPGPMRNFVWDLNTAFNFQPNILTKALDALPLIQATAPSSLAFEGEIAQVIPNPNTLNNDKTGDKNGVAYLDDFEGSKREVSLGVIRNGWGPSSLPRPYSTSLDIHELLRKRGNMIWYNPYNQVSIKEIWPNRETTTNYGGSTVTNVLTLEFQPNPSIDSSQSWGGILRYLSSGYADQTNSKFLEIMVKATHGILHVDLGKISEDVIPNEKLDTEDKKRGGFFNNLLDDDEDTGLDGMFGADPPDPFYPHEPAHIDRSDPDRPRGVPYDFWDVDGDGIKDDWEPWSYDDWYYKSDEANYTRINGTENNKNDGQLIYPNTEDMNASGDVDLNNDFFEYKLNLDQSPSNPDTKYIAGNETNPAGWRLYRIPLNQPDTVIGTPQWSRIQYARIWIDGVTQKSVKLSIADITLVGNEWKFQGVALGDSGKYVIEKDSVLEVAVMNTHDNPEYTPPPGVEGVIDPIQKIQAKEQSLSLKFNDLSAGATAIAQKQFYQPENLINYKTLKMFVHGGGVNSKEFPADADSSRIDFFLRWGSDTENKNYYEIRIPVFRGWDQRNNIELDFELLSQLKVQAQLQNLNTYFIKMTNGQTVTLVGKPSLTNIRWLIVGVKNKDDLPFNNEIWIDELRLSNVRKDKGLAVRARADFKLSDFFSVNGEYNRIDADFHTVNERFGEGATSKGGNLNASVQLHKLLPASWGFSVPLTTTYSKNQSTPKYIPGTDILLNKSNPLLEQYQNNTEQKGFSVSVSKNSKSRNLFTRLLLDPVSGSFNFSQSKASNSMTEYSTTSALGGAVRYRLSPSDQNYILPFRWLGKNGIFKKIAQTKFNYLPRSLNLDATGNRSNANSKTREGIESRDTTSTLSRTIDTSFQPFSMLGIDYSKSSSSDMRFAPDWSVILTDLDPGIPTDKSQNFGVTLNPKLFTWFNPTAKFSANYRWSDNPQFRNQGTGTNASISSSWTLNGSLDPNKIIQSFGKKKTTIRKPVIQQPLSDKKDEKNNPSSEKKDESKPFILLTLLSNIGGIFKKLDPISIGFTETKSSSDFAILGTPSLKYQFGFSMKPGVEYSPDVTTNRNNLRNDYKLSLRSGIKITSQLSTSLDYNFSNTNSESTQKTSSVTKSVFILKDNGIPFPSWNVQWRGLEKIKFLSTFMKSLSLTHTFSGQQVDTYVDKLLSNSTLSKNFRPLLGVSMNFKNGITGNIQYNTTISLIVRKDKSYGIGKDKQISNTLSLSADYSKHGGIRLPFLKNKKLENNIDFKLTFEKSLNGTYRLKNSLEGNYEKASESKNWSFEPRVNYSFSSTVQGGCYLKLGQREDLRMGKTKITAFGINANISLAGR